MKKTTVFAMMGAEEMPQRVHTTGGTFEYDPHEDRWRSSPPDPGADQAEAWYTAPSWAWIPVLRVAH